MSAVENYLNSLTPSRRAEYERIRKILKDLAPEAEEVISYGMPTFKLKGRPLLYFGAFTNHMSIFPGSDIIADLKSDLDGYKVAKGTIQFTEEKPLPDAVIKEVINLRLKSINEH